MGRTNAQTPEEPAEAVRKPRVGFLQQMVALAFVVGLMWLLFGEGSPLRGSEGPPRSAEIEVPAPRIASTSPAITETLWELGLVAHIVGRSPYCRRLPSEIPVVGDLRDFDAERLALAKPDALFVQPPLAGVDPALREFCAARGIALVERRIESVDDTRALVEDVAKLAADAPEIDREELAGRLDAARKEFELFAAERARASREDAAAERPKVLLLVASEPFLAVGRGNYLDELLASCGLGNALEREGWVEVSPEGIVALRADAILGLADSERGRERLEEAIARLPWPDGTKARRATRSAPELLAPSLVALRARGRLRELYARAVEPPVGAEARP